ncbi:MAG: type II toxin-antitoxin system VapC family toxin [Labilithrix sp.]|nr:type II toxin-antitoxin system VapC family toxin [Labilithrix sp.]MCW5810956.1 type II toxin-antitoxin system VapC family toxin [Labilithrix sp.]
MILLDTHALLWWGTSAEKLGRSARRTIALADRSRELVVSAISYLELGNLVAADRVKLTGTVADFRRRVQSGGILEIPVDGEIAIMASRLEGLHGDPMDRIIFATALREKATLVTADAKLLEPRAGPKRVDAQS